MINNANLGEEAICVLISNEVVCGFATVSTTTTWPPWASPSSRISSSPSQLPPFAAMFSTKSSTNSVSSSASGSVSSGHPNVTTSASHGGTGSVVPSPTTQSSLGSGSSKVSRPGHSFRSSKHSTPTKLLSASTMSRDSLSFASTSNAISSKTFATLTSSYSHAPNHSRPTVSSQSCSLCTTTLISTAAISSASNGTSLKMIATSTPSFSRPPSLSKLSTSSQSCSVCSEGFLSTATKSYSSSRAQMRFGSHSTSSASQTTTIVQRSSGSSGPFVSVSSASSVLVFYEALPGGVMSYYDVTATITSPPPNFTTTLASNSQWTGDTTTVSDGTTYPVIYGCPHCGGKYHGIVISGLGGRPKDPKRRGCGSGTLAIFRSIFGCGTAFKFLPKWNLPPFIINPSGDPIPSAADPDTGEDPDENPDEEPTGKPTNKQRSNEPSLSRASSTPSLSRVSSTPTHSLTASSVASCSPTSTPNLYAIFLVDGITNTEVDSFSAYLQEEVGGSDVVAPIPLGANSVVSTFAALIDNCVASKIDAHPSVSVTGLKTLKAMQARLTLSGTDLRPGWTDTHRSR